MTVQLDFDGNEVQVNRSTLIRNLLADMGGASTREVAQAAIDGGIFSAQEIDAMVVRAVQSLCRRALKELDPSGKPYAGQTTDIAEDGGPIWKNRGLWNPADYDVNVAEYRSAVYENHRIGSRLADECEDRFGERPFMPEIAGALELA